MLSYILAAAQLIYVKTFMKNKTGKITPENLWKKSEKAEKLENK
jgi:hypothetical protein